MSIKLKDDLDHLLDKFIFRTCSLLLIQIYFIMNLFNPISEIMSTKLHTLSKDASIAEAGQLFKLNKIHHIPIEEDGVLIGMVSKSDFLFFKRGFLNTQEDKHLEEIRLNNYEVSHIMTKGIATMEPDERINIALEIFKENIFHAIPITKDKKLIGIVTTYDIINHLAIDAQAYQAY